MPASAGDTKPRALVAGAGIGGLAAALALRRAGYDPLVLESSDSPREAGAGLLLGANAVAALHSLGLNRAASGLGVPVSAGLLLDPSGDTLADLRLPPRAERLGADSVAVLRSELLAALLDGLGEDAVRTGSRVSGFRADGEGVTALLDDGREERGRMLVGADGLYSVVREGLHGGQRLRYAGYTGWRGVARGADGLVRRGLMPRGTGLEVWGSGVRFGCVYLGGGLVYWFATRNAPEGVCDAPGESREYLLGLVRGWCEPVESLLRATPEEEIRRDDLYDRAPLLRWGSGPVTLLGDAAHPMTPNLGQGAGQALVDAAALGEKLSREPVPERVLRAYERRRALPAAALVLASRLAGAAGQVESPALVKLRNRAFRGAPERLRRAQLRWMLGYGLAGSGG